MVALADLKTKRAIQDAHVLWDLSTAQLRDIIATEREQLRAFGPVAEACRDELAKRTGSAQV